ncbi:hypothetical protein V6N13_131654 [Hibiscus sabdariffa]
MVHVRFTGLGLGLLFVLYALKNCPVRAHQGMETDGERHLTSEESLVSVRKEFVDGFGGRKMGRHEVEVVRKESGKGVDSKNSGANYGSDGKCDFEGKEGFSVKCKTRKQTKVETDDFVAFGADYGGPKRGNKDAEFQDQANNQIEEAEAAKEIINLMHKDYRGMEKPRQKPPINNRIPRN